MRGINKFKNDLKENINSLDVEKETFRNIITGNIYKMMNNERVNKNDLAKSLKISESSLIKMLSGDRNFTIDKITEICNYLEYIPNISFKKKNFNNLKNFKNTIRNQVIKELKCLSSEIEKIK